MEADSTCALGAVHTAEARRIERLITAPTGAGSILATYPAARAATAAAAAAGGTALAAAATAACVPAAVMLLVAAVICIRVDILPQQGDLSASLRCKPLHLMQNGGQRPAALTSPARNQQHTYLGVGNNPVLIS